MYFVLVASRLKRKRISLCSFLISFSSARVDDGFREDNDQLHFFCFHQFDRLQHYHRHPQLNRDRRAQLHPHLLKGPQHNKSSPTPAIRQGSVLSNSKTLFGNICVYYSQKIDNYQSFFLRIHFKPTFSFLMCSNLGLVALTWGYCPEHKKLSCTAHKLFMWEDFFFN